MAASCRAESWAKSWAEKRRHACYGRLLAVCVLVMGCIALPHGWNRLAAGGYALLPLLMIRGLSPPIGRRRFDGWLRRAYIGLGLASLLSSLGWYLTPLPLRSTGVVMLVIWTLFVGWSAMRLVEGLAGERQVNGRVLMGAVAGYLLIGLTAGLLFSALETIQSGSFSSVHGPASGFLLAGREGLPAAQIRVWQLNFVRLNYFAFVCLTTLGFGDIHPITAPAQIATVSVAAVGTIYVAVVMGLLISRYTLEGEAQEEIRRQAPQDPKPPGPGRGR